MRRQDMRITRRKKIDYGLNEITIGEQPKLTVFPTGDFAGTPCIEIKPGTEIKLTNKELSDHLNTEFPLISRVHLTDDPTLFSDEFWSFIKYDHKYSEKQRLYHITTTGHKYIPKFLYELHNILIEISNLVETPPEFISWCNEDDHIKNKVQFNFETNCVDVDITFVRYELVKLGTWKHSITILMGKGWKSYADFADQFVGTIKYPGLKVLPNIQKLLQKIEPV